jgi:cellobiose phosphorylase
VRREGTAVIVTPPAGSELARRFPQGHFAIEAAPGSPFVSVSGDQSLFADGRSRGEPFVCIEAEAAPSFGLRIFGRLLPDAGLATAEPLSAPRLQAPPASPLADDVARLGEILPWFTHNALVHYLAPRGLEQYSGGGWGTRDVCQGPLEMLLAFGRTAPARDLLLRTFAAQNADGDWPQWFMFFERDRAIRAGDSHGDIVFWPLLALARYLIASGDAALLDEPLPFHGGSQAFSVWQHVQRALALIEGRRIGTTHLVAYWHGDWNDALQPADPALRQRLCSAWTVTLHHQMLLTLASALRGVGRAHDAEPLAAEALRVQVDFQRLLVKDGVVAGYAMFPSAGGDTPEGLLLHPSDRLTGLRYSLLPMMHAVLEDMLPPAQALQQLALIRQHLHGPDGARLFDAPMAYRGGPQTLFQRAESSAYFGREIGVMYMHAHLRYAEALAHVGDAEGFFAALCRAHPIGLQRWVPSAARRQANCYYSSSDAAFADRFEAWSGYARIAAGTVALEGGWRIYSSGPGIALNLVLCRFVGIACESNSVVFDPVLPPTLDGLRVQTELLGRTIEVRYRVGPRGCGVQALTLDGRPLQFTRRPNPHRKGAAVVARAPFEGSMHELLIEIG